MTETTQPPGMDRHQQTVPPPARAGGGTGGEIPAEAAAAADLGAHRYPLAQKEESGVEEHRGRIRR